jgi:methyl-accepting chemotaxis protein
MSGKFHTSLKVKLLASTLGVTLLLSMAGATFLRGVYAKEEHRLIQEMKDEAEGLGYAIGAQFFERYGDVQAFAQNSVLFDQSSENRANIEIALNEYIRLYGIYTAIVYVGTDGRLIASNTLSPTGKSLKTSALPTSFADESWFRNALNGNFTNDKERGFSGTLVEDAQLDAISTSLYESQQYGNSFTSVVRNREGKVIGVLTNRADFVWVETEALEAFRQLRDDGFGDVQVAIVNSALSPIVLHNKGDAVVRDFKILVSSTDYDKALAADITTIRSLPESQGRYPSEKSKVEEVGAFVPVSNAKFIPSVGWGISITNKSEYVFADFYEQQKKLYLILATLALTFMGLCWMFSSRISQNFLQIANRLKTAAESSHKTALDLTRASKSVSDSSTDQSAAVQETVSSMSEITSMIAQTNTNVKECTQIASRVSNRSEQGNQTMRKLVAAMDAVNHANAQLQNMANIINEVSAKTMVINDIVFKTQLLSINASIEAARAGQHGKGFAVVAEEVGNLAQMSGNAAKEIQLLISDSQKQVLQIIEVTQSRSKESQSVSQEAVQAFSEIASGIVAINERLGGVTQATHEQEIGIQQISLAMTQMDQSTQRNSSLAAEANTLASDISRQSEMSYKIVKALRTIVMGSQVNKPTKPTNIVDSLIEDDQESSDLRGPEVGGKRSSEGSDQRLLTLVGQFENKMKSSPAAEASGEQEDFDADDDSFKKPA